MLAVMRFVARRREPEVILLDGGHGPRLWIRVSRRGILPGVGHHPADPLPA